MTTWRVGMKAVCVVGGPWFDVDTMEEFDGPQYDDVFIVTAVCCDEEWQMLSFSEFPESTGNDGFAAENFRPAVSRPTDISLFKEILHNPQIKIREDA